MHSQEPKKISIAEKLRFSYPNSLPVIGAIIGVLISVSYYLGVMFSQLFVGRPSSTWILGFFWLPMLAFKPGLIGLVIGLIAWLLLRPFYQSRPLSTNEIKVLKVSFVLIIAVPMAVGVINVVEEASRYSPHIVHASGEISKLSQIPDSSHTLATAVRTWEMSSENPQSSSIAWNSESVSIYSVDTSVYIVNQHQMLKRVKLGNDDIWYISRLYAIPLKFQQGQSEYLAVLALVRTLRDCSILLIFDPQGQMIYQEILKDIREPSKAMRKMSASNGRDILVIDMDSPVVYGTK